MLYEVITFLEAMDTNIEELISKTEISPILNDMYWGAFFASGDVSYIDKLIDKLQYINERENKDLFLAAGTAKWSLGSNALFHPKVNRITSYNVCYTKLLRTKTSK